MAFDVVLTVVFKARPIRPYFAMSFSIKFSNTLQVDKEFVKLSVFY